MRGYGDSAEDEWWIAPCGRYAGMTNIGTPSRTVNSTDEDLLSLYLSLPPVSRDKTFVSTAQAAKITGVSMRTIQLWIESGTVRAIIVGGKYRIVLESLRAHLDHQMKKRSRSAACVEDKS